MGPSLLQHTLVPAQGKVLCADSYDQQRKESNVSEFLSSSRSAMQTGEHWPRARRPEAQNPGWGQGGQASEEQGAKCQLFLSPPPPSPPLVPREGTGSGQEFRKALEPDCHSHVLCIPLQVTLPLWASSSSILRWGYSVPSSWSCCEDLIS